MSEDLYTNRQLEEFVVKSKDQRGDFFSLDSEEGWSVGCSRNIYEQVNPGDVLTRESQNGSTSGWMSKDIWLERETDAGIEADHKAMREETERRNQEYVAENRERWQEMEDSLPEWLQSHMTNLREKSSDDFESMSWSYNLMVAKLASLYVEIGETLLDYTYWTLPDEIEPEAVREFARNEGTTGAQHGMAIGMAKAHLQGTF